MDYINKALILYKNNMKWTYRPIPEEILIEALILYKNNMKYWWNAPNLQQATVSVNPL